MAKYPLQHKDSLLDYVFAIVLAIIFANVLVTWWFLP